MTEVDELRDRLESLRVRLESLDPIDDMDEFRSIWSEMNTIGNRIALITASEMFKLSRVAHMSHRERSHSLRVPFITPWSRIFGDDAHDDWLTFGASNGLDQFELHPESCVRCGGDKRIVEIDDYFLHYCTLCGSEEYHYSNRVVEVPDTDVCEILIIRRD